MKNEIMQRIKAVMQTMDGGIEVSGVKNAGNLAGCYQILSEVMKMLNDSDIIPLEKKDEDMTLK